MSSRFLFVLTSVDSDETASAIAQALVERRLAACVNVIPGVLSTYRWHGEVTSAEELMLLVKTTEDRYEELTAAITELHPYDVPEIVALSPDRVSEAFGSWIAESSR